MSKKDEKANRVNKIGKSASKMIRNILNMYCVESENFDHVRIYFFPLC